MARISLLFPTRGRPYLLRRLFDSLAVTCTDRLDDLEVILYLDDDDKTAQEISDDRFSLIKIIGPRLSMGAYNTICLGRASGDFIMLMNDDVIVRTFAWDRKVAELGRRNSDGIFLAYPNDLHIGKRMCTFPILNEKSLRAFVAAVPRGVQNSFYRLAHFGHL